MIGIDLDLRIERRRIEPAARVRVKCGGVGCIVVYETAEKQPRFSLVEHSCREQIVYQVLKRTNSTTEDFECACRLCGYVVGCSPQRAEQLLLRPEAFIQDGQVELNLIQGIRAGFERLYAAMDRCRGRISGITLPA